jgi:hypothetical protein
MGQPSFVTSTDTRRGARRRRAQGVAPALSAAEHVMAAASARSDEWSADAAVDPGDSHDKGEASLCVGEAV